MSEWAKEETRIAANADPATGALFEEILANAGADLLFDLLEYLLDYVAFPSMEAAHAVTLWAAHTHFVAHLETTPRLAALSPEKGSGKTRLLECLEPVCATAREAVNVSTAAMFRMVATIHPTLLFDEADTFFGPKAKDHEELRGLINSGHRQGAKAWRCVGDPKNMRVEEFPSYCAVALAGIGDLPDTILDRAVLVRMRRRRGDERVRPFRRRHAQPVGKALHDRLAGWAENAGETVGNAQPDMPAELTDRPADVWEPLIAIADEAGGIWPEWARNAAVKLNAERQAADPSFGVRLLADLRGVFADADRLATVTILDRLNNLDEAPWGEMPKTHRPLDARGLAYRLRKYEIGPKPVRLADGQVVKGYEKADCLDAWTRYLSLPQTPVTSVTAVQPEASDDQPRNRVTDVTDNPATHNGSAP